MFSWLLRKLGFISTPSESLYLPKERKIYAYWNGQKIVKEDPMVLYKRLMEVGPELAVDIRVANSTMKGNVEASNELVSKIRNIFDIKPYDKNNPKNSGLTELQLTELLSHFFAYCEIVKKNIATQQDPTSTSEATVSPTNLPSGENQATNLSLDSTGIEITQPTDSPTPPLSESESPSDSSNQDLIILGPSQMGKVKP